MVLSHRSRISQSKALAGKEKKHPDVPPPSTLLLQPSTRSRSSATPSHNTMSHPSVPPSSGSPRCMDVSDPANYPSGFTLPPLLAEACKSGHKMADYLDAINQRRANEVRQDSRPLLLIAGTDRTTQWQIRKIYAYGHRRLSPVRQFSEACRKARKMRDRIYRMLEEYKWLRPVHLILTMPDGPNLDLLLTKFRHALRKIRQRAWRDRHKLSTPFARLVWSYRVFHVSRNQQTGLWRVHAHLLALRFLPFDVTQATKIWHEVSGGTNIIYKPLGKNYEFMNPSSVMRDVYYCVRYFHLPNPKLLPKDRWDQYRALRKKRLVCCSRRLRTLKERMVGKKLRFNPSCAT